MREETQAPFEELVIQRREMLNMSDIRYRVYENAHSFKLIEGKSALEALRNSGIKKAYKIEKHNPLGESIIELSVIEAILGFDDKKNEAPPTIINVAEQKEEVLLDITPPVRDEQVAALSNDDINKLLNG